MIVMILWFESAFMEAYNDEETRLVPAEYVVGALAVLTPCELSQAPKVVAVKNDHCCYHRVDGRTV